MQPPAVGAGGGPLCVSRVIHQGADELLIQQDSVPDGEITSVQEGTQRTHPLSSFLSDLIDVRRPAEPCI
jgi:hypothetical protein